jgi:glycosyltransferase involved in cell wall biosynthesis
MAADIGLKRISFEGMRSDTSGYYRQASVVCLVSETEGWPLALTEGQAQGCIGIGFGCTSGIKEILEPDGECGFIVPPFDEDAYAETLLKIASSSEDELLRLRRNSIEKRARYAPEMIAEKWKTLFDQLVVKY